MFGFLKSLLGVEPDIPVRQPKRSGATGVGAATRKPSPAPIQQAAQAVNEERALLLEEARRVHRAKRKIFDHLSDEDKAKLVSMAILTFMNQGREPDSRK